MSVSKSQRLALSPSLSENLAQVQKKTFANIKHSSGPGTPTKATSYLSASPTHLLLEVTSRYMSVGEPDYKLLE